MPILGIIASAFRSAAGPQGAYDALATVTVPSGGVATVTFAGIPTGYKHLQIRYLARSGRSRVANSGMVMRLNGSYGTYSHSLTGDGAATPSASAGAPSINGIFLEAPGVSATSGFFGTGIIDILDYASGTKNPTVRALSGDDCNGSGRLTLGSQFVNSTAAISSLTFETVDGSTNIQEYSSFALYGVK
jgi:hypothetical protein